MIKRLLSLILALVLTFQPFVGVIAVAEDLAVAEEEVATTVENQNTAEVVNEVEGTANTGDNVILEPTPTQEVLPETVVEESVAPTPSTSSEQVPEPTATPTLEPTPTVIEETIEAEGEFTPTPTLIEITPTPTDIAQVAAVNTETATNSINVVGAAEETKVEVANDNTASVENSIEALAQTGENNAAGNELKIETGEAKAETDLANIVNTNLVGNDFWQIIVNVLADSQGNIDLTNLGNIEGLNAKILSVLAANYQTGDGSTNMALANFISSTLISNYNQAVLTNNINLQASTGTNAIVGNDGQITTRDAAALLNLFNLVNTNLIGTNWFFGNINIFGDLEGDIILPYEFDFLGEEGVYDSSVLALNESSGDGSTNTALASLRIGESISNQNLALVDNQVSASANSGQNTIIGDGDIASGNAGANVNLLNFVNTNIYGSRWVLLAINNMGNWTGNIFDWWGNTFTVGKTTYLWAQLPVSSSSVLADVSAINSSSGQGSINLAQAQAQITTEVLNRNSALVDNNIQVGADTGGNSIVGGGASIATGNAQADANILNMVNTNIIGNHWYFGMINIFDNFWGNIVFPRPDLVTSKSADKTSVVPGEEINYSISVKNVGRVVGRNVEVIDVLPSGVTFVSASGGGLLTGGQIVWHLGDLCPGEEKILDLTVRVDDGFSGEIINQISAVTSTKETNQDNNNSSAIVMVASPTQPGGSEDQGTGGQSAESQGCHDTAPGGAPQLFSAIAGENEVTLTWGKAAGPVSYYLVAYGLSSGDYIFGNPNVGGADTTSVTIKNLTGGQKYYFVVRAGNGCTPGPFSNELSATPFGNSFGLGGVLGAETGGLLGEALSTEAAEDGEVAGITDKPNCRWSLILTLAQLGIVSGYFGLVGKEKRRFWWLVPISAGLLNYFGDSYAHRWYDPSRLCDFDWFLSIASSALPTSAWLYFAKK